MNTSITPTRFRLAVQAVFTLFCLYVGLRFVAFLAWAVGSTEVFTPKPGAVEGFLPISALMGLRRLFATGQWDTVHPAGLAIFIAVLLMAFLFRKGFCGYICPVGFLSGLLERLGRRMGLGVIPPKLIDLPLTGVKYLLLGGFIFAILSMDTASLESFISSPFNLVSDAKMLHFFTHPTVLSLLVISVLVVLNVVVRNFWCRYLCPYGALLGLLSWAGPSCIRRNTTTCIDCGKCAKACPAGITVQTRKVVHSPECIGCGECVGVCPIDGCLGFSIYGRKRIPWLTIGIGCVATLLLVWAVAKITGHWDSVMPQDMIRNMYSTVLGTM